MIRRRPSSPVDELVTHYDQAAGRPTRRWYSGHVREVGVHEAKTHLSQLLRGVEAGEEVFVTRGGRAVAKLVPVAHVPSPIRRFGLLAAEARDPGEWTVDDSKESGDRFGIAHVEPA